MDNNFSNHGAFASQALDLLNAFGQIGKTPAGGYSRLVASPEEKQARDYLCDWLKDHGFAVRIDPIGNIFGILDLGVAGNERAFFCGSHIDSQPNGGNFDGCLGIVCACVAGLFLKDKIAKDEIRPSYRYYVVTCWTGEEGARFQPSLIGSSVFSGALNLESAWRLQDEAGIYLKDALELSGYLGSDQPPQPDHYLELHIEQDARLEKAGDPIAVVEACWGAEKLRVVAKGKADHTGPTPMEVRRNALLAAARVVVAVEAISRSSKETLFSSVGRMKITPNSPNTVAERAELWVEFRSASQEALEEAVAGLTDALPVVYKETGCDLTITSRERRDVVRFDETALEDARAVLSSLGITYQQLTTIAGHDAVRLQSVCPSTLLFIPSKDGITHSPSEFTTDEDVCTGFNIMTAILASLISRPARGPDPRRSPK